MALFKSRSLSVVSQRALYIYSNLKDCRRREQKFDCWVVFFLVPIEIGPFKIVYQCFTKCCLNWFCTISYCWPVLCSRKVCRILSTWSPIKHISLYVANRLQTWPVCNWATGLWTGHPVFELFDPILVIRSEVLLFWMFWKLADGLGALKACRTATCRKQAKQKAHDLNGMKMGQTIYKSIQAR